MVARSIDMTGAFVRCLLRWWSMPNASKPLRVMAAVSPADPQHSSMHIAPDMEPRLHFTDSTVARISGMGSLDNKTVVLALSEAMRQGSGTETVESSWLSACNGLLGTGNDFTSKDEFLCKTRASPLTKLSGGEECPSSTVSPCQALVHL